jgi:parvulin-like peptidyl-prolyl isomerase
MPGWAEHRGPQVERWRADLEERYLAEALEAKVRSAVAPSAEQVRSFYDANPALFTQPEKFRLGIILLKADPSAGKAARDRVREEAAGIRRRLDKGADFAELAKIHSGDDSAANGGDMGFVHRGALPEPIQAVVDKLERGRASDPIDLLEGVAIVRVLERQPSELRPYAAVSDRARELLRRQAADEAWKSTVAGLRAKAKIVIDPRIHPELAAAPDAAKAATPASR